MGKLNSMDGLFAGRHFDREVIISVRTLEPFWRAHGTVVACRRNVPEDSRQVGVPLSGGGSSRPDSRLHPPRQTRRGCSKSIFQEGRQASGPTTENYHARWLRSLTPRRARDEGRRLAARRYQGQILEVPEQPDRARPSQHQVPDERHARLQTFQDRFAHTRRYRVDASHSQGAV